MTGSQSSLKVDRKVAGLAWYALILRFGLSKVTLSSRCRPRLAIGDLGISRVVLLTTVSELDRWLLHQNNELIA